MYPHPFVWDRRSLRRCALFFLCLLAIPFAANLLTDGAGKTDTGSSGFVPLRIFLPLCYPYRASPYDWSCASGRRKLAMVCANQKPAFPRKPRIRLS